MITRTSYAGCSAPVEYRITKQVNGVGRLRWTVESSDFKIGCNVRKWDHISSHRTLARAEKRLARLERDLAKRTWVSPKEGEA